MEILAVTPEDARELLGIYAPYVLNTAISFEYIPPSIDEFESRIKKITSKYPYIKAVEDGKILGYAYASEFKGRRAYDWSVETSIYVREGEHNRKIGTLLYNELERILGLMGVLNMNACIALPRGEDEYLTDGSVKFHEKVGYNKVGIFHNSGYKFNTWYDMIWMEKMIGEHTSDIKPVSFGEWRKFLEEK